jgi:hypothetical protein
MDERCRPAAPAAAAAGAAGRTGGHRLTTSTAARARGRVIGVSTWTAQTIMKGRPEDVLDVLTDPEACVQWAPVDFEVEGLEHDRLAAGCTARVAGRLAGRRVGFDLEVYEAAPQRLSLRAVGPIALDVAYEMSAVQDGSHVVATIGVSDGAGLGGRLLARATDALLAGGALDAAISRIAREVKFAAAA